MIYLLSKDNKGKFRLAIIDLTKNDLGHYCICRTTGCVKVKLTNQPIIEVTKTHQNRTWLEQANLQYNQICKKFLDKGYVEVEKHPNEYSLEELEAIFGDVKTNQYGVIKPQLAKQADKVTNTKIFDKEWLISRKLDGVKALFYYKDGEIHTASRGGEHYDYSTEHLRTYPPLVSFFKENPTVILDGELFVRGKSLQQISGAARMEKNAYDCDWLQYWIYDCYDTSDPEKTAVDRWTFLVDELNHKNGIFIYCNPEDDEIKDPIRVLDHQSVKGWTSMKHLHDVWVSEGFEGAVITDPSKPYKPGARCNNLIKIKEYKSEDFKVIGYKLGLRGSEDMTFTCELEDGRTFEAMPVGDRATKEEYVENFENKYKGHKAECTYFNLSDEGVPTQPKLRVFRFDLE